MSAAPTRYADDWQTTTLAPVTPLFGTPEARAELNRWAIARLRQKRAARTQLAVRALFYSALAFALTGTAWLFLVIMAAAGDRV